MSLDSDYDTLRNIINDCCGYRILDDDDTLQPGDETACASLLLGDCGDWHVMDADDPDFKVDFDKTVFELNSDKADMDASERLFRRKR